jgi:uncharacterized damage-inducible protein DinB
VLERLFAHLRWADSRTLAALRAAPAPPAKALEVYSHILGAEHVWLSRLRQEPATAKVWPDGNLEECSALADANHAELAALLATLDGATLDGEVPYTNSAGLAFRSTRLDILIHVALHGCYHRGQVALLVRESGAEPEPTDYIAFVRGAPAATRRG